MLNDFQDIMLKDNFSCLDFNLEFNVKRNFHKNNDYNQSKSISTDIQVKLNASNSEYDKQLLYNKIQEISNNNISYLEKVDFINFIPDYFEKFDEKYTKPKVVIIFYTTEDEDTMTLLEKLVEKIDKSLESNNLRDKFHEIYFRRKDTDDCLYQDNNNLEMPAFLSNKKIIKLPKKISKCQFQNGFNEFFLALTNQKNEVIYFGQGLELNLESTLENILNNTNNIVFEAGLPIKKDTMNEIKNNIYSLISSLRVKLNEDIFFYKPMIEFSYKKIYDYDNMSLSNVYYNNLKLSISVKDIHEEVIKCKEIKKIKKLIEKEYKGLVVVDASSETVSINPKTKKCFICNDRSNQRGLHMLRM